MPPELLLGKCGAPLPVPLGLGVPAELLPMLLGFVVLIPLLGADGDSVELVPDENPPIGCTPTCALLPVASPVLVAGAPPLTPVLPNFAFSSASCLIFSSQSGLP